MLRRDFFKSLSALFAVAAIDPIKLVPVEPDRQLISTKLKDLVEFMHGEIRDRLDSATLMERHEGRFAQKWFQVGWKPYAEHFDLQPEEFRKICIEPTVRQFVSAIKRDRLTKFVRLDLPHVAGTIDQAEQYSGNGFSLTGIRAFDLIRRRWIIRFDIAGAQ